MSQLRTFDKNIFSAEMPRKRSIYENEELSRVSNDANVDHGDQEEDVPPDMEEEEEVKEEVGDDDELEDDEDANDEADRKPPSRPNKKK